MCDTLGILKEHAAYFAKNSDRSPNEAQVIELYSAKQHKTASELKATYIELEQAERTNAMLLSRPVWMWGAEMGVNEHGVCIGNEAVFTKGAYSKTGLTGMDLVRLALERADSAYNALNTILELLEKFGQGGNCGYDKKFYYDNSFLIMDRSDLYVLETAGRNWAYKKSKAASISNRLSIGSDGTKYSNGQVDFAAHYSDPLFTHFSGSKSRLAQTGCALKTAHDAASLFEALRTHTPENKAPLTAASLKSPCMHFGGLVGDHTTSSMVVELGSSIKLFLTGSSTPCISLFKPYELLNPVVPPVFAQGDAKAEQYWREKEQFHRSLISKVLPKEFYDERDVLESRWLKAAKNANSNEMHKLSLRAFEEETCFYARWKKHKPQDGKASRLFLKNWEKKNTAFYALSEAKNNNLNEEAK